MGLLLAFLSIAHIPSLICGFAGAALSALAGLSELFTLLLLMLLDLLEERSWTLLAELLSAADGARAWGISGKSAPSAMAAWICLILSYR
jgi:hypothetical protein